MSEERKYKQGDQVYLKLHPTDARVLAANHCGYIPVKILHLQQSNCMVEEVDDVPFRKTYRVEHELLITKEEFSKLPCVTTKISDPDKKVPITELAPFDLDKKTEELKYKIGYFPHPSPVSGLPREPVTHRLKATPETMRLLRQGEITSNIRKHDRDYRKGDKIIFNEYIASPTCIENKGQWTSATFMATITHVQGDNCDGLATGYCVLSLAFKLGECLGHDFELGGKYDPR